jgi:Arc/MetJ family transcription regulator
MRTTITLDDDVAAQIEKVRRAGRMTFKEIVNHALREGLQAMERPAAAKRFRTRSFDAGACLIGNVDDIAEVLAIAEGDMHK